MKQSTLSFAPRARLPATPSVGGVVIPGPAADVPAPAPPHVDGGQPAKKQRTAFAALCCYAMQKMQYLASCIMHVDFFEWALLLLPIGPLERIWTNRRDLVSKEFPCLSLCLVLGKIEGLGWGSMSPDSTPPP